MDVFHWIPLFSPLYFYFTSHLFNLSLCLGMTNGLSSLQTLKVGQMSFNDRVLALRSKILEDETLLQAYCIISVT